MGSGTALEISVLRKYAKGAYQSLLAWMLKKSFFLLKFTHGLNKIFQSIEQPAPQAQLEPQWEDLPPPLSEITATLQSVTRVADLKIGLLSVIQNIEAYRLATDNKISTLTNENKRLVAVNEQQARKITELEIVKPCPHANTINNLTNEIAKFQSKLHTLNSAKHQKDPKSNRHQAVL